MHYHVISLNYDVSSFVRYGKLSYCSVSPVSFLLPAKQDSSAWRGALIIATPSRVVDDEV
jgi:hypothetical protein